MDTVAHAATSREELDAIVAGRIAETQEAFDSHLDRILMGDLCASLAAILNASPEVVRQIPELQPLLDLDRRRLVAALSTLREKERGDAAEAFLLFAARHIGHTAFPPAVRRTRIKAGHPD